MYTPEKKIEFPRLVHKIGKRKRVKEVSSLHPCDSERLMSISSTEQIIFPLTASVQFLMRVLRFLVVVKRHWINPTPSVKVFGDILARLLPCPNRSRGDCSRLPSGRNCQCNRENFRSCYFRVFKYIIKKEEF